MSDRLDQSPSGAPSRRHRARKREFLLAGGDAEAIKKIGAHIEMHIGPVDGVYHEIVSDLVHIDVHCVSPDQDRPFHTLITSGMSDLPMTPPQEAAECRYAELLLHLPADWSNSQEVFGDEAVYWPFRELKALARLPHQHKSWLWYGHTVGNGDPPEPYAPNTRLCAMLLASPSLLPREFEVLRISEEKEIAFFSLIPLYPEELDFKLRRGAEPLLDRLYGAGLGLVIDPGRKNLCL
ncbi:MAG: suppressor of fused domain protein [Planctomycetes bacterium]|nr:suppressor of fused domain protein [Planctomycetota bacterium]